LLLELSLESRHSWNPGDIMIDLDFERDSMIDYIALYLYTKNWPCLLEETIAHCEEKLRTPKISTGYSTGYGALV
jgi:hypothetical protein